MKSKSKLTRKEFLAAAATAGAIAGAASLAAPAMVMADSLGQDSRTNTNTRRQALQSVEVEYETASLGDSPWAVLALPNVEVIKSYDGLHMMNEPGYFAFTGWDAVADLPTDAGFGLILDSSNSANDRFVVNASKIECNCSTFEVSGGTPFSYSINETCTGKKWINGKLIYRKVINTGSFSNQTASQIIKDVSHGISGITEVIDIHGVAKSNSYGATVALPRSITAPGAGNGIDITVSASAVSLAIGPQNSFDSSYVILEYTKA